MILWMKHQAFVSHCWCYHSILCMNAKLALNLVLARHMDSRQGREKAPPLATLNISELSGRTARLGKLELCETALSGFGLERLVLSLGIFQRGMRIRKLSIEAFGHGIQGSKQKLTCDSRGFMRSWCEPQVFGAVCTEKPDSQQAFNSNLIDLIGHCEAAWVPQVAQEQSGSSIRYPWCFARR